MVAPSKVVSDLDSFWTLGDSGCYTTYSPPKSIGDVLDANFESWLATKTVNIFLYNNTSIAGQEII